MHGHMCLSTHVVVRVWASLLCEYGQSYKYVGRYMFVHVTVYVFMWLFHVCSYVHILHLYVRYDYVQPCEDSVSVELRYINQICH